jgi:hypothetical protein
MAIVSKSNVFRNSRFSRRKSLFTYLIAFYFSLFTFHVFAQWQPDVRLTNNPAVSYTSNSRCLTSNGAYIHVVWEDERDGNREIYYKRTSDEGASWEVDTRLTNYINNSLNPSITVSGSFVHVVWEEQHDGNPEIYYKRSSDSGLNWDTETRLTNNPANSFNPSIMISGINIHLVWIDTRIGNNEIYYKSSNDNGASWGADIRLTNNSASSYDPSVSVSGSNVHVVWIDGRSGNEELYYKQSTDGGLNWGTDLRINNITNNSLYPCVTTAGLGVHVIWQDFRDGNAEIYYKRSTNSGTSWEADKRLTHNTNASYWPSITVSGSNVHVVWYDERDGNGEIYYKQSADGGVSWGVDSRLTNNNFGSVHPSVTVSGLVVHVIWTDGRNGNNGEIYYKQNPTGNPIGIINIGSEIPGKFSLGQNYPNPFNPLTKIRFDIAGTSVAQTFLSVHDILGREVETLFNEPLKPGSYEIEWDASSLSSGVYFYKIEAVGFSDMKKMILIK